MTAKQTSTLKEFCEFVDAYECNILCHIATRWLSLLPAIERVLQGWSALKSYFQTLGEDNCVNVLWSCFEEDDELSRTYEMYFYFLSHALKIFSDTIRKLEAKPFSVTNGFREMSELKSKVKRRQRDSYFGFETACKLEQLHPDLKRKCILDFSNFYDRALNYISKRYDLSEENFHARIAKLSLEGGLTFAKFGAATSKTSIWTCYTKSSVLLKNYWKHLNLSVKQ